MRSAERMNCGGHYIFSKLVFLSINPFRTSFSYKLIFVIEMPLILVRMALPENIMLEQNVSCYVILLFYYSPITSVTMITYQPVIQALALHVRRQYRDNLQYQLSLFRLHILRWWISYFHLGFPHSCRYPSKYRFLSFTCREEIS